MINLQSITPDNWRLGLRVSEAQKHYVANNATLLARAYAYRNYGSEAYVIFNDEIPIGMTLYYECDELNSYVFSEFFIDEKFQGQGLGYEAAMLLIQEMKDKAKYSRIDLCYIEGNEAARKLYEKCGFCLTGECDEDEVMMRLEF